MEILAYYWKQLKKKKYENKEQHSYVIFFFFLKAIQMLNYNKCRNEMKKKKYLTVGTIPKSNIFKILDTVKMTSYFPALVHSFQ